MNYEQCKNCEHLYNGDDCGYLVYLHGEGKYNAPTIEIVKIDRLENCLKEMRN